MSFVQGLVMVDQSKFKKNYLKTHTQIKTKKIKCTFKNTGLDFLKIIVKRKKDKENLGVLVYFFFNFTVSCSIYVTTYLNFLIF